MSTSPFATRLAVIAQEQHETFHMLDEADPVLCKQIKRYWNELRLGFTSCVTVAWSAVFVSWCVKKAGATALEFKFARRHSEFVHEAIRNAINGEGVFHGLDITAHPPGIGDIIQNNRGGTTHDFSFARTHKKYESHSTIVTEVGQDTDGGFALVTGGNEGNSIRRTIVRLDTSGFIKQRRTNPFICVVKNLK
jgi:hypothetical protein